jgi:hypothetical protein
MSRHRAIRRRAVPSLDQLEGRQLLSVMPTHHHHHGRVPRHAAVMAPAGFGPQVHAAAAPLAGTTGLGLVASPAVVGSVLYATTAIAANDIWAVGAQQTVDTLGTQLIEHFDGTSWKVIPSPSSTGALYGVSGTSSHDVWAVGSTFPGGSFIAKPLIEHWNGTRWSVVATPTVPETEQLNAVVAIAPNNVYAVGGGGAGTPELIEHFDGRAWSVVQSPILRSGNGLFGVSATSAGDVWAVGEINTGVGSDTAPEALHFDGKSWTRVAVPAAPMSPFGSGLASVTEIAPNNVWAVGHGTNHIYPGGPTSLIEHFDGTKWTIVPTPDLSHAPLGLLFSQPFTLRSVAAVSASDIWAVGFQVNPNTGAEVTLTEHFDGKAWSVVPSPDGSLSNNELFGVTALPTGSVVAVGFAKSNDSADINGLILRK